MKPWGRFSSSQAAADGAGDLGALLQARHIRLGVLLEMKRAALPGHGGEDGGAGGLETDMVISDDEL